MKFNRRTARAVHTRYMKGIKHDFRRISFQVIRAIDAKEYELPPYRGTKYRGYKKWLAHSEKWRKLQKLMKEVEG